MWTSYLFFSFFFLFFWHYMFCALQNQLNVLPRSKKTSGLSLPFLGLQLFDSCASASSGSAWDRAELYQLSSKALISPMDLNKIKIASSCIDRLPCRRGCSSSPGRAQLKVPWCSLGEAVPGPPRFGAKSGSKGLVWRCWRTLKL